MELAASPVSAEEYRVRADQGDFSAVREELSALLSEEYAPLIEATFPDSVTEADTSVLRDRLSFGKQIEALANSAAESIPTQIASIAPLCAMLLLMAAAGAVMPENGRLREAFFAYANLACAITVFRHTAAITARAGTFLTSVCGMMNLFVPVMEAVCLLGGNLTEQAVTGSGVLLLVTLIGNFNTYLLVPLTSLLFTFSAVTMACPAVRLGGAVGAVRKLFQRLWTIMGILFSFLLGMQTLLARASDSLAAKTARFALGSFVPMAGGMLAEALSTMQAGVGFVRKTAGIGGILLILALLAPGIVPLFFEYLTLSLTASAADLLGLGHAARLLCEVRGIVELLCGIVLVTALLFVLALILFAKTQTG